MLEMSVEFPLSVIFSLLNIWLVLSKCQRLQICSSMKHDLNSAQVCVHAINHQHGNAETMLAHYCHLPGNTTQCETWLTTDSEYMDVESRKKYHMYNIDYS